MNSIDRLAQIFKTFPGIGARQARRFVYELLSKSDSEIQELQEAINRLVAGRSRCGKCMRTYMEERSNTLCPICLDESRKTDTLMVVAKDIDMETVEKSRVFSGMYFILGGTIPILEKDPENKVRINELVRRIDDEGRGLKEVILAFNLNPEGDYTAEYIKDKIARTAKDRGINISLLGRGLSSGAELEYADTETLLSALKNRE